MIRTCKKPSIAMTLIAGLLCATALPVAHADEDVGVSTGGLSVAPGQQKKQLYRLRLKDGNRYLDHGCAKQVVVRSGGRAKDPCQLWQVMPQGGGWFRLQAGNGRFLDADHCTRKVGLSGRSEWEGGACQLWRLSGNVNGWSRLQLRHGNHYLDAEYCKETVSMHPGSDWAGGACQQWRLTPE
jgi:hypothetical protein